MMDTRKFSNAVYSMNANYNFSFDGFQLYLLKYRYNL